MSHLIRETVPASATAAREEVIVIDKDELIAALEAICRVPSERTLLLNAEARAMYEIAKRALEAALPSGEKQPQ